jgi:predicted peptidase
MRIAIRTMVLSTLILSGCVSNKPETVPEHRTADMQVARQFTFQKSVTTQLDYLLFLPKDYNPKSEKRWPLILFLHGSGERGTNVWKVATHGPPKIVNQRPDFPFIVVSPQCPEGQTWSNEVLLGLLDKVCSSLAIDTNRVYLTGLSMGGYGTWSLGLAYPGRFAAMVPICGGGEIITVLVASSEMAQAIKTMGIWAFHGGKDPVVPLEESQRMVEAVKKIGASDVKLTVFPEAGHDSWTEAYNNPELYDWLLKHQR